MSDTTDLFTDVKNAVTRAKSKKYVTYGAGFTSIGTVISTAIGEKVVYKSWEHGYLADGILTYLTPIACMVPAAIGFSAGLAVVGQFADYIKNGTQAFNFKGIHPKNKNRPDYRHKVKKHANALDAVIVGAGVGAMTGLVIGFGAVATGRVTEFFHENRHRFFGGDHPANLINDGMVTQPKEPFGIVPSPTNPNVYTREPN